MTFKQELLKNIDALNDFNIKLRKDLKELIFEKKVPAWQISFVLGKELYNVGRTAEKQFNDEGYIKNK